MDVYISFFHKSGKARPVTFGFVWYKLREEMVKAVKEGNNRKMDGRLISVKESVHGKPRSMIEGEQSLKRKTDLSAIAAKKDDYDKEFVVCYTFLPGGPKWPKAQGNKQAQRTDRDLTYPSQHPSSTINALTNDATL
ncbi:hypothetical protein REPUB_Repub11eG0029600 [Reevesia pubescens]